MNILDEKVTKEEVLKDYVNYPPVNGTLEDKPFYQHRYEPIFYEIPIGSKVLDCGVNDGVFAKMLVDKRQCDLTGIDVSQIALDEAKQKGLNVMIADVENLPFPNNSFDVVIGMELFSHLFDPKKAVSEMKRVLKKNGILLGSVPHENIQRYAWEDKRLIRKYYTLDELSSLLDVFDMRHIKTLTGAQFSMNLAESFLGTEPCEMLFKCGKSGTLGWDSALQDKSVLRCWFSFTQSPGTAYYRMAGFADKMQKLGAETHYNPYNEDDQNSSREWTAKIHWLNTQKRFTNQHIVDQLYTLWKAADLTVWQVIPSQSLLMFLTALRDPLNLHPSHPKKPLWLEMDDWMFDIPSYNIASHPYHPNSEAERIALEQVKLSDGVITSTQYLKEKIEETFPGKKVYVVRNSIDFDIWDNLSIQKPAHELNKDLIRIGFTGCGNHSGDLEIIKKPLLALLDEFPNLEFITLPFSNPETNETPAEVFHDVNHPRLIKWAHWVGLSRFPQMIANWELDIGIAPLKDSEFNRSKSNLRWLEYSALKVPTIASNIYPFKNSIRTWKDGVVIGSNPQLWYDTMKELILNKEKREKIGQEAYTRVKKEFNMDDVSKEYLSVLKNIKQDWLRDKRKS